MKAAIITDAGSGIGLATARFLAYAGLTIVSVSRDQTTKRDVVSAV